VATGAVAGTETYVGPLPPLLDEVYTGLGAARLMILLVTTITTGRFGGAVGEGDVGEGSAATAFGDAPKKASGDRKLSAPRLQAQTRTARLLARLRLGFDSLARSVTAAATAVSTFVFAARSAAVTPTAGCGRRDIRMPGGRGERNRS
jgi:hypothetical protein